MRAFCRLLRHDRILVLAGLSGVIAGAWLYLLLGAGIGVGGMDMARSAMTMPAMSLAWTPAYAALMLSMWAVMMAAMMLPSAAPTILLVSALAGKTAAGGRGAPGAAAFALGYLSVWACFSIAATLLQFGLSRFGLLSQAMASRNGAVSALILIAAGLYQWTPLKRACLVHCRSPLEFLVRYWRKGMWREAACGFRHGMFCLGCCWMLMGLLLVGGLMNLLWIVGLALLVLIEKTLARGDRVGRVTGIALVGWGTAALVGAVAP